MRILGISSQYHDAAVTVVDSGKIVFAAHSERYSRVKNDPFLCHDMINEALAQGKPDAVVFHEKPTAKRIRRYMSGDFSKDYSSQQWIKKFYPQLHGYKTKSYWHHETHAAAGVLTSEFDKCAVMVIDAIGEFDTASIWHWKDGDLKKLHSIKFPNSLGLFYSAMTQYVGLKPLEDEYILMGMAAYGRQSPRAPYVSASLNREFFNDTKRSDIYMYADALKTKVNLQKGMGHNQILKDYDEFELAYGVQILLEQKVIGYARLAKHLTGSDNLVFMGGVALNCVLNSKLCDLFNLHIMPNPGDAGSSLGAACLHYYTVTGQRVEWQGPYLGTKITGKYPVEKALASLAKDEIFGIANGRAEFGPRALGNRSLLANPKGGDIKDRMNAIKHRQEFRPFAPVILEEHAHDYFDMPVNTSPYMSYIAKCKYPEQFPAIVHVDGTSRVQTVNRNQHPGLYDLLNKYYHRTGCPMLLNTSLNIKGQPIVNNESDAHEFSQHYSIPVHIHD
jgi:carbamoyltransferase